MYLIRSKFSLILGISSIILSVIFSIWTPFDLLMDERLRMRPGLPPFEWWRIPPTPTIKIYVFNVTNVENFLNGIDSKIKIEQVGPVVFKEHWEHENVTFNDNSTISYNVKVRPVHDEESSKIGLDSMIVIPNMILLGSASYLWDTNFIVKYGFNGLIKMLKTQPFISITVRNFLYNFTDPLLNVMHQYAPSLAPVDNMGIMRILYEPYGNNVTAFIGTRRGHEQFSLINSYNGEETIPGYTGSCKDPITNASEGVVYNQFVSKTQLLKYYRKLLCRIVPLVYEKDVRKSGLKGYKFIVSPSVFNRTSPREEDCYKSEPSLLDGLSDLSNCLYSFPLVGSFPHFLFGDSILNDQIDGLNPNNSLHHSYVIVEPITGIPLEEIAMIQININIRSLSGFNRILAKFSDKVIPVFWLEVSVMSLPYYVLILIYLVIGVRYLQWVFVGISLVYGLKNLSTCKRIKEVDKSRENESFLMKNFDYDN